MIDFDRVLRDPNSPIKFLALYDSGDYGPPNDSSYNGLANAIDLRLFSTRRAQHRHKSQVIAAPRGIRRPSTGERYKNSHAVTTPISSVPALFVPGPDAGDACETHKHRHHFPASNQRSSSPVDIVGDGMIETKQVGTNECLPSFGSVTV